MAKTVFKAEAGALGVASYASALVEGEKGLIAQGQRLLAASATTGGKIKAG